MGFLGSLFGGGSKSDKGYEQALAESQRHNREIESLQREQLNNIEAQRAALEQRDKIQQTAETEARRRQLTRSTGRRSLVTGSEVGVTDGTLGVPANLTGG
jgi:hypothetical protein